MKKISKVTVAFMFGIFVSATAFASTAAPSSPTVVQPEQYYATAEINGSSQTTFDILTETPYIYYRFSEDSLLLNPDGEVDMLSSTVWTSPEGIYYQSDYNLLELEDGYYSYTIGFNNWEDVKVAGDWQVDTLWYNATQDQAITGGAATNFTVTPEPVSILLMAIGGLGLYFKRK